MYNSKNSKSSSVIDQGYSYLSTMLNNKSDFILEYIENADKLHNGNIGETIIPKVKNQKIIEYNIIEQKIKLILNRLIEEI